MALTATAVMASAVAREFLIQLESGDEIRIPVNEIAEVRFDANETGVTLPEDPYPSATDFSQKMLILDHTGTDCGNCPLMSMAFEELEKDPAYSSTYTLAALHSYEGDPMGNALIREISAPYVANGWPTATVNFRPEGVGAYERYQMTADRLRTMISNDLENLTPSGLASISTLDDNKLNLTLSMKAGETGRYRIGAFVVEDGIRSRQTNYYPEVTGDRDLDTHNNVVRTVVGKDRDGGYTGIELGYVRKGEVSYTTQELDFGSGWKAENCYLVLYVTEQIGDRYVCVNSTYAPIIGETSFEYDSQAPATDSYISLGRSFVESESAGGDFSISFEMVGDTDASLVKAEPSDAWIENVKVEDGAITFTVAENDTPVSRTGHISVAYGDARPIDITVRQTSSQSEQDDLFIIETDVLTPYSASVSITPNGYDGNYLFLVAKASVIDSYIEAGNLQGWIEGDLEYLKQTAEYNGLTLSEMLPRYRQGYTMNGEPTIMTYSDLSSNTEYYIYCYGLTLEGEVTTSFYKKRFETKMVDKVDLDFSVEISDLSRYGANVEVTPSSDEYSYFWTYVSEMDWVKYDLDFIMDQMIQNILYEVSYGYDIYDIIHVGPSSENIQGLWAGTRYHLVGWGMDEKGTPTTTPKVFGEFTTLSDEFESDCTFTLDTPDIKDNDIQIHITPTDNSIRYYVACVEESLCAGYDDYQMAQRIINMENARFEKNFYGANVDWSNAPFMLSGEQTVWGRQDLDWTFNPEYTYHILVFGVNGKGERNTDVSRIDRTTLPAPKSDLEITMTLDKATYEKGTFTFYPSNDDEYYIPLLVETEELQYICNPDGTINEAELSHEITHYYDDTPNYYTLKGVQTQSFNWIPDRDYTMLVCGWSGGNTTRFFRYETHTPAIPFNEGTADVAVTYELFDGTELSQLDYNRWKEYQDFVIIRLAFEPTEDAAFYCGGVWMPKSTYEDVGEEAYLLMLIQNPDVSIVNRKSAMYRTLSYNTTYSLSYIAKDSQDRFGPWHYEEFTPKKGVNITEAYDFWTRPDERPAQVIAISPEGKVAEISDLTSPSLRRRQAPKDGRIAPAANGFRSATPAKAETLGRN